MLEVVRVNLYSATTTLFFILYEYKSIIQYFYIYCARIKTDCEIRFVGNSVSHVQFLNWWLDSFEVEFFYRYLEKEGRMFINPMSLFDYLKISFVCHCPYAPSFYGISKGTSMYIKCPYFLAVLTAIWFRVRETQRFTNGMWMWKIRRKAQEKKEENLR